MNDEELDKAEIYKSYLELLGSRPSIEYCEKMTQTQEESTPETHQNDCKPQE